MSARTTAPAAPDPGAPGALLRRAFLAALLGTKPRPDAVLRVAVNRPPTVAEGRGAWRETAVADVEAAATHLERHADGAETYAALAWSVGGKGAEHVVTRGWLSADLDDKAMPGSTPAERHRQARMLAGTVPCPGVVVDSGRGIHVHIRLPEGERLEDHADGRRHVAILGRALRLFLEQQAEELFGAAVALDHCHGPERVWRIPPGWNCKVGEEAKGLTPDRSTWRPVELLYPSRVEGLAGVAPADLMFLVPYVAAAAQEQSAGEGGRTRASPPPGRGPASSSGTRFDLNLLPPRLRDRWPLADMNPSKADFAVATALARGGHPRAVAEAGVRARRQAAGDPEGKGEREDYVARTVERAYDAVENERAKASGITTGPSASPPPPTPRQPFPLGVIPPAVRRYLDEGARCLSCCVSMLALPVLIVLGAAIGTTRRIRLRGGARPWVEPSVFWGAVVAESGSLKSPALDFALELMKRHEVDAARENEEARKRFDQALERFQRDLLRYRRNRSDAPAPSRPDRPRYRRHLVGDTTIEALGDRLADNPRGLLLGRDELSAWIKSFDAYRSGGRGSDAAKWLELHNARPLSIDRKSSERSTLYVPRAAVSIVGGIQPGTLARALTPEFYENGLAARLLVTMPARTRRRWNEAEVSTDALRGVEDVLERLLRLTPGSDGEPLDVVLTPAGKSAWISFFNEHAKAGESLDGGLAAAWSKAEGYAARFALLVSLIREAADDPARGDAVDEEDVQAGVVLARWFAAETERVYGVLAERPADRDRRRLADWIATQGGVVTARDVARGPRAHRGNEEAAERALQELVAAGWGTWEEAPASTKGGRPTRKFVLRPDLTGANRRTEPPHATGEAAAADADAPEPESVHEYDFQGERREWGVL